MRRVVDCGLEGSRHTRRRRAWGRADGSLPMDHVAKSLAQVDRPRIGRRTEGRSGRLSLADPEFEEKEEGSNDKRSPVARKCAAEMQEAGTWAKKLNSLI